MNYFGYNIIILGICFSLVRTINITCNIPNFFSWEHHNIRSNLIQSRYWTITVFETSENRSTFPVGFVWNEELVSSLFLFGSKDIVWIFSIATTDIEDVVVGIKQYLRVDSLYTIFENYELYEMTYLQKEEGHKMIAADEDRHSSPKISFALTYQREGFRLYQTCDKKSWIQLSDEKLKALNGRNPNDVYRKIIDQIVEERGIRRLKRKEIKRAKIPEIHFGRTLWLSAGVREKYNDFPQPSSRRNSKHY